MYSLQKEEKLSGLPLCFVRSIDCPKRHTITLIFIQLAVSMLSFKTEFLERNWRLYQQLFHPSLRCGHLKQFQTFTFSQDLTAQLAAWVI